LWQTQSAFLLIEVKMASNPYYANFIPAANQQP